MEAIVAMRWTGLNLYKALLGALLFLFGAGQAASAQSAAAPQTSLTDELDSLATRAGAVFAGQVVSIERYGSVVEIGFRVEQPVLGPVGASFTLREWAGMWPQGQFRYFVGERALVFLRQASAAGFSSPVDGADGVVPVVVKGSNAPELLDIRRLAAAILRAPGTPLPTEANGAIQLSDAVALVTAAVQPGAQARIRRPGAPVSFPLPMRGSPAPLPASNLQKPALPEPPVLVGDTAHLSLSDRAAFTAEVLNGAR